MAEVKNSNYMGLGNVVNTLNMKTEASGLLEDIDGSIAAPSDYSELQADLFGNSSNSSDDSDNSLSTVSSKAVKIKKTPDKEIDEEEEDEEEESYESYEEESESSDIEFNDPVAGVKGVVNLEGGKSSSMSKSHVEILDEIRTKQDDLMKYGIPVPKYKQSKIKRDPRMAAEVLKIMTNLLDDNKGADSLMSLMGFALKLVCTIFNGRHELAGFKLDLRGYNVAVISDLKEMRDDTIQFTKFVRKKIGKDAMKVLQLIKIFGINAAVTIWNNNSATNTVEAFGDELDEDEYDEDDDEEEEEEEDE